MAEGRWDFKRFWMFDFGFWMKEGGDGILVACGLMAWWEG
jgi:hypothetical protein